MVVVLVYLKPSAQVKQCLMRAEVGRLLCTGFKVLLLSSHSHLHDNGGNNSNQSRSASRAQPMTTLNLLCRPVKTPHKQPHAISLVVDTAAAADTACTRSQGCLPIPGVGATSDHMIIRTSVHRIKLSMRLALRPPSKARDTTADTLKVCSYSRHQLPKTVIQSGQGPMHAEAHTDTPIADDEPQQREDMQMGRAFPAASSPPPLAKQGRPVVLRKLRQHPACQTKAAATTTSTFNKSYATKALNYDVPTRQRAQEGSTSWLHVNAG